MVTADEPISRSLSLFLDVSVEQVALLAQQNTLPEPTLDISLLSYNTAPSSTLGYGQPSGGTPVALRSSPAVAPPADDPWTTGRFGTGTASPHPFGVLNGGAPSSVAGSGLPSGWWKRQENVSIQFGGQQGFVLNRYMVYSITTEVRGSHTLAFTT
jgi:sorting nexin-8